MKLYQITVDCGFLLYIRMFDLRESRFQEKKEPVNFTPNSSIFFFFKFLEFEDHSVVDVHVRETNIYVKHNLTCYLVIKPYLVRTCVFGTTFIRYTLIHNILEPNNFEIFDSKKTTVNGPKLNSHLTYL